MNPFFSIVIPIYNIKEEYLRQCIESTIFQGDIDYEVILINDGSSCYCEKICQEYAKLHPFINYIYQENQGVSVALNTVINASKGEYIVFLDADDWLPKGFLKSAYEKLGKNRPDIIFYGYSSEYSNRSFKRFFPLQASDFDKTDLINSIIHVDNKFGVFDASTIWAKFIRREMLDKNGIRFIKGVKKGQDRLFSLYVYQACQTFDVINGIGYCYRKNNHSIMHRFNENIVSIMENLHSEYARFLNNTEMKGEVDSIVSTLRINALLGDYLNLYYVHKDNQRSKKDLMDEFTKLISREPYRESIKVYKPDGIIRKIQIFALKKKKLGLIWAINRVQNRVKNFVMSAYR